MSDLLDDLQAALGPAYRVDRELGGGGMSRVFAAEELALGRQVAVKVLAPDLMPGVSIERFRREMQVAAQLQHPAIVPVLSTGSANGLTWFTMPLVPGDTLRQRLLRDARLPIPDVLRYAKDLFEALAAAHGAGVMHRDIKPENLLLVGRHLQVADFGVARALTQSAVTQSGATGGAQLTGVGIALGTPAYMAPEQALADSSVDHRADLYAAGLVVYEMLAGLRPFEADTPQGLVAAHLTQQPRALAPIRTDAPPALVALVMQCLEKDPTKRPAGAREIVDRLEGIAPRSTGAMRAVAPAAGPPRRRSSALLGGFGAMLLIAGGLFAWQRRAPAEPATRDLVVVGEFAFGTGDAGLAGAVQQALRIDLGQSPRLRVPDPGQQRTMLRAMQQPDTAHLTGTVLGELARRLGAKAYVDGAVARAGSGFVLTARLVTVDGERELAALREAARDSSSVLDAIDRLARALRETAGESVQSLAARQPLPAVTTRSLAALELLAQGASLIVRGEHADAARRFEQAIALDSTFASAWRGLAVALSNTGTQPSRRWAALRRAYALRVNLPEAERLALEGTWYYGIGDWPRAEETYRALIALDPEGTSAPNNLSIVLQNQGRHDEARALLAATRRRAPASATLLTNLNSAYLELGDTLGALAVIAAAESAQAPARSRYRAQLLLSQRRYEAAEQIGDSMLAIAPAPMLLAIARDLAMIRVVRGRIDDAQRTLLGVTSRVPREDAALTRWSVMVGLASARLEFFGDTAAALRQLEVVRREVLASRVDPVEKPYLGIAIGYAAAGRTADADALLARHRAERPPELVQRDTADVLMVRHLIATARGAHDDALRLAREAARLDAYCGGWCWSAVFARTHDRLGQPDSTLAHLERFLRPVGAERQRADVWDLAWALKRSGELHESRGDPATAIARYRELVQLWENADAPLQPLVADLQQRIARLEAKRG